MKILIVDDEENMRHMLSILLKAGRLRRVVLRFRFERP